MPLQFPVILCFQNLLGFLLGGGGLEKNDHEFPFLTPTYRLWSIDFHITMHCPNTCDNTCDRIEEKPQNGGQREQQQYNRKLFQ